MSLWRKAGTSTYTVVGLATDCGTSFVPAVVFDGDMRPRIAHGDKRPYGGSVVYVVRKANGPETAAHRAVERFEADAANGADVWEEGEVFYL